MVALAGGFDVLGRSGEPSHKVEWPSVVEANPDLILLMPCGFDVRRTVKESAPLHRLEGWSDLAAVKAGNVYALNGNAYFSRPGPRLVNGLEILARIIQAEDAFRSFAPNEAVKLN
jgi:iron complex transport system substrate-binding protein